MCDYLNVLNSLNTYDYKYECEKADASEVFLRWHQLFVISCVLF